MVEHHSLSSSHLKPLRLLLLAALLLAAFWIDTADLQRESLWNDEAWTAWAVQPLDLRDTVERVRGDVHPPLYFVLLNLWVRALGDSVLILRLPSTLFGMVALAATYAVGRRLFDPSTGILALMVLATAGFFVYYTREARMYSLLLALGALSMLLYLRWRDDPYWSRATVYGLSMALLLYTHYAAALLILSQIIHLVAAIFVGRKRLTIRLALPFLLALILFMPWLPIFLSQMKANPNGPLAIPVPTDWAAVAALILILTSANWGWFILPFIVGVAIPRIPRSGDAIFLLLLWLLLTPVLLLALNVWVTPVYQVRYAIAMLPGGALLLGYALRHIGLPLRLWHALGVRAHRILLLHAVLVLLCTAAVLYSQLSAFSLLWPDKPPWETTIQHMIAARHLLEPTITDIAPASPAAYYDRHLHIRQGVALDLSWHLHSAAEVRYLADIFRSEPSVWVALPINTAKAWHIVAELDKTRHVGYRDSLSNMIFYRFDAGSSDDLRFRFGDLLRYQSGPGADQQFWIHAGDNLCLDIHLQALTSLDGSYSAGLHLVDLGGTTNAAGWDGGLPVAAAGQSLDLSPCLAVPPDTSPGHDHLELVIYKWSTLERLPIIEDGAGKGLGWQDVLMLAAVDVLEK